MQLSLFCMILIVVGLRAADAYLITYTDYHLAGMGGDHRPSSNHDTYHHRPAMDNNNGDDDNADDDITATKISASHDQNQMIVFNVGDFVSLDNYTRSFR